MGNNIAANISATPKYGAKMLTIT